MRDRQKKGLHEGQIEKVFTLGTDRKSVYMRDRQKKCLHGGTDRKSVYIRDRQKKCLHKGQTKKCLQKGQKDTIWKLCFHH